jgi:hypothetical protein
LESEQMNRSPRSCIGLVESFELYQLFEEAMAQLGVARDVSNQKPILSDQHPSLMSVGSRRTHFWCLRHLVEKFGANPHLGEMRSRLAFCSTPDHFASEVMSVGEDGLEHCRDLSRRDFPLLYPGYSCHHQESRPGKTTASTRRVAWVPGSGATDASS